MLPAILAPLIGFGRSQTTTSFPVSRCPHAIRQRVNEGVDAAANVLHVENKHVDVL
jgi:hypothetical protein